MIRTEAFKEDVASEFFTVKISRINVYMPDNNVTPNN
jgi:hypothetical protein